MQYDELSTVNKWPIFESYFCFFNSIITFSGG